MPKKSKKKATRKSLKKWIVLAVFIGVILILTGFFASGFVQTKYKEYQLQEFYSKIVEAEKNSDFETLYSFLSPEARREISIQDFIDIRNDEKVPVSQEFNVMSYTVDGDQGIVDREHILCYTEQCEGADRIEDRARKEYTYINGKWYALTDNTVVCLRQEPYPMPEEFSRALSLIIQRLENSQAGPEYDGENWAAAKDLRKMRNCIDIIYGPSWYDMSQTHGQAFFEEDENNPRKLNILISPNYRVTDDLLTAITLRHELEHARTFAFGEEKTISCFEVESVAFASEVSFYEALNDEEKRSLQRREDVPVVADLFKTRELVLASEEPLLADKALDMVKNMEFYQEQCSDENWGPSSRFRM